MREPLTMGSRTLGVLGGEHRRRFTTGETPEIMGYVPDAMMRGTHVDCTRVPMTFVTGDG